MNVTLLMNWIRGGPDPYTSEERAKLEPRRQAAEALVDELLTTPAPRQKVRDDGSVAERARGSTGPERTAIVQALAARGVALRLRREHFNDNQSRMKLLIGELLSERFEPDDADLRRLLCLLQPLIHVACQTLPRGYWELPVEEIMRFVRSAVKAGRDLTKVKDVLEVVRRMLRHGYAEALERRLAEQIDIMLGEEILIEPGLAWADAALADLAALAPEERAAWQALLRHAHGCKSNSASERWRKTARSLVEAIGADEVRERVERWASLVAPPAAPPKDQIGPAHLIPERSGDTLRGLVFTLAAIGGATVPLSLGDLGERCLKKVTGVGPLSGKVGNACVTALGTMPGPEAIAQLERLRRKSKYAASKRLLERGLDAAAERAGLTRADLEELSVPTFDLGPEGLTRALGGVTGRIRITGTREVALDWLDAKGRARKAPPAEAKAAAKAEIAALRRTAKEIAAILPGQRDRIERLALEGRSWPVEDWRARYLRHPLLSGMVRRLIWRVTEAAGERLGIPWEGELRGIDGRPLTTGPEAHVSLWHPLGAPAALVGAWRERLHALQVTQPWKQAHREVYVLTDAERATRTYSNRFAGHILRQHQLAALCRDRGWRYRLQGEGFDGANVPTLELPREGLRVELGVDLPEGDEGGGELSGAGINLFVTTDRVRFVAADGAERPLEEIPALLLSEVLRDVDLFVGVASVGTDPTWRDGGPARHAAYWARFSTDELGAAGETRKAVLESLVPRLEIAPRASIAGRFLVIRGDRRTYKIHIGSANILMEPNDQYLCIVAAQARDEPAVALPFEGDALLSLLLSKALLLAGDASITDPSILSQIGASLPPRQI